MNPSKAPKPPSALAAWCAAAALLLLAAPPYARAQSFCSSNGQPRPVRLMERFISADCASCWTDPATARAGAGVVVLDWIVPSGKNDEAPLSAVASADVLVRLQALNHATVATRSTVSRAVKTVKPSRLRVAHGLPLADYLGASIELKPIPAAAKNKRWTSWLALVETLPAGTEDSPVERNLVRNLLLSEWSGGARPLETEQNRFFEQRSMTIAPAAVVSRLRVIGWVEDEKGQLVAAAQSRCTAN